MMDEKEQRVTCKVVTCQHNTGESSCELNSIKIKPRKDNHSGHTEDESMCSDYKGSMT